ncbi:MAG: hypothetical protein HKN70_09360, partial [Gammaproteobacteria bacterium]|nr:hypothetical protein [Gammaproteobacteria bacterium]
HRLYVGHDSWKETVLDLMGRSQLIVLRIGLTEGILWELKNAIDRLPPESFVIWIVPGKGERIDEAEKISQHLHEKSAGILPEAIPLEICKSEFIYFSAGWKPHPAKNLNAVLKALNIGENKTNEPELVAG